MTNQSKISQTKVYDMLKQFFQTSNITPNMSLQNDLGADSLDMVELSIKLEKEFNIDPDIAEALTPDTVKTVQDLVSAITNSATLSAKLQKKAQQLPYTLFEMHDYKPYCRLTDRKCRKIRGFNADADPCLESGCKLAKKFWNIVKPQNQR